MGGKFVAVLLHHVVVSTRRTSVGMLALVVSSLRMVVPPLMALARFVLALLLIQARDGISWCHHRLLCSRFFPFGSAVHNSGCSGRILPGSRTVNRVHNARIAL